MKAYGIVFPGQGSQSVGMLSSFSHNQIVRQTVEEASHWLHYDMWELIQHDPHQRLNETIYTQLAMLTADVAMYRFLQQHQLVQHATIMAGHSLGEYAALVCSQALAFLDAIHLVQQRATLMQQAVPIGKGAMAAIVGLADHMVQQLCDEVSTKEAIVMPANYNALDQVVVAGEIHAVQRLIVLAESHKAYLAKLIPVSVPCHCHLLKKISPIFDKVLKKIPFASPACPVLSNVDAQPYQDAKHMRMQLQKQLYQPVQWVKTIQCMATSVTTLIECGPGRVLTGLIKRINKNSVVMSFNTETHLQQAFQLLGAS